MNTEHVNDWINRSALYIALIVAWAAMLGSLYFSEILGYIPCQLCWYQRIFMYPMAGLLALGLLRYDTNLPHLVIPFTVIGGAISTYHYLLQKTNIFDSAATCQVGVPCSTTWINWFGFVTIPFLALLAFFLITVFSLVAVFADEPTRQEDQPIPWLQVGGTVITVIAVFAVVALVNGTPSSTVEHSESEQGDSASQPYPVSGLSEQEFASSEELYLQACAACHGPDAAGIEHLGNPLLTTDVLDMADEEALAFIRKGVDLANPRNNTGLVMPGSGGRPDLADSELMSIVNYLRFKSEADSIDSP